MIKEAYFEAFHATRGPGHAERYTTWEDSAIAARVEFVPDMDQESVAAIEASYMEGQRAAPKEGLSADAAWLASEASALAESIARARQEADAREAKEFSRAMQAAEEVHAGGTPRQQDPPMVVTPGQEVAPAATAGAGDVTQTLSDKPGPLDSYFRLIGRKNDEVEVEISLPYDVNMMVAQMAAANDQGIQEFLTEAMEEYLTRRARQEKGDVPQTPAVAGEQQ